MLHRYNFDRYRGAQKMAEGISVHAADMDSAVKAAEHLNAQLVDKDIEAGRNPYRKLERLEFRNMGGCDKWCAICGKK